MSNATVAAAVGHPSTAYKVVPEHSSLAISSGLERLLSTPASSRTVSRESSGSSALGRGEDWEASTAGKRHKARALKTVGEELDEYLEEPLETFSKTERVNDNECMVVFDILTYWQVRITLCCLLQATLTSSQNAEKRFPNLFYLAMDVLPAQASSVSCERLFSSGKETYTPRRNRIQPMLMEALQALKASSRTGSLDLTEHLSAESYPLNDDDLEVCQALDGVYDGESAFPV